MAAGDAQNDGALADSEVFLDEAGAEVDVELDEVGVADCFEGVDFAGFDDEDVAGATFEGGVVDGPNAAAFADELDLVVGMAVRAGAGTGLAVEEEDGDAGVALLGADELMRTAYEGEIFLADVQHLSMPS